MMDIHDQMGRGGGAIQYDLIGHGGGAIQYDLIGAANRADAMGQRGGGGGGGRGGGFRGGGFRGGFRGSVNRGFVNRSVVNVPWWGWWPGYAPWAYGYPYAAQAYNDACAALGRAVAQGAPQATIDALRAQCAQQTYGAPAAVAPAYPATYATPFAAPGFVAY